MLSQACIISYNSISISHLNARLCFFFFPPYLISIEGNTLEITLLLSGKF